MEICGNESCLFPQVTNEKSFKYLSDYIKIPAIILVIQSKYVSIPS